jgi:hypothetical protein
MARRLAARGRTRRELARLAVGGAGVALFGAGGVEAGGATCRAPGERCKKAADCCATGCRKKRGKKMGRCKRCPGALIYDSGSCCATCSVIFNGGAAAADACAGNGPPSSADLISNLTACLCAVCATECASFCSGGDPSEVCRTCLGGSCPSVGPACLNDA